MIRKLAGAVALVASLFLVTLPTRAARRSSSPHSVSNRRSNQTNTPSGTSTNSRTGGRPATTSTRPVSNDASAQASAAMDAAQQKVEQTFEATPEWLSAQSALNKAQSDYDSARTTVVNNLKSKPDYQTALATSARDEQSMATLRDSGTATADQLTAAANTLLTDHSAITAMETNAIAMDSTASAAQTALTQAADAVSALRVKEHAAVLADPAYQAAKQKYDQAMAKANG